MTNFHFLRPLLYVKQHKIKLKDEFQSSLEQNYLPFFVLKMILEAWELKNNAPMDNLKQ